MSSRLAISLLASSARSLKGRQSAWVSNAVVSMAISLRLERQMSNFKLKPKTELAPEKCTLQLMVKILRK
jgi:hypothetical protein